MTNKIHTYIHTYNTSPDDKLTSIQKPRLNNTTNKIINQDFNNPDQKKAKQFKNRHATTKRYNLYKNTNKNITNETKEMN